MISIFKPYTGYLRELFSYTTYFFRPRRLPAIKFLIVTIGRTGSNLLVSLLNSHPLIHCDSELLVKKVFWPKQYIRTSELLSNSNVFGFKFNTYNVGVQQMREPKQFINDLYNRGYFFICLKRRNIMRQAISRMYAHRIGKYHLNTNQADLRKNTLTVTPQNLVDEIRFFTSHQEMEIELLKNIPHLTIYYEDHLEKQNCHQETVDLICSHLCIPTAEVGTNLIRIIPENLSDIVENYIEFVDFVKNSEYSEYLEG